MLTVYAPQTLGNLGHILTIFQIKTTSPRSLFAGVLKLRGRASELSLPVKDGDQVICLPIELSFAVMTEQIISWNPLP